MKAQNVAPCIILSPTFVFFPDCIPQALLRKKEDKKSTKTKVEKRKTWEVPKCESYAAVKFASDWIADLFPDWVWSDSYAPTRYGSNSWPKLRQNHCVPSGEDSSKSSRNSAAMGGRRIRLRTQWEGGSSFTSRDSVTSFERTICITVLFLFLPGIWKFANQ